MGVIRYLGKSLCNFVIICHTILYGERIMGTNDINIVRSPGAKKIEAFCKDYLEEVKINLRRLDWAEILENKKYTLTINVKSNTSTTINFSCEQINGYHNNLETEDINSTIKMKIDDIKDEETI